MVGTTASSYYLSLPKVSMGRLDQAPCQDGMPIPRNGDEIQFLSENPLLLKRHRAILAAFPLTALRRGTRSFGSDCSLWTQSMKSSADVHDDNQLGVRWHLSERSEAWKGESSPPMRCDCHRSLGRREDGRKLSRYSSRSISMGESFILGEIKVSSHKKGGGILTRDGKVPFLCTGVLQFSPALAC